MHEFAFGRQIGSGSYGLYPLSFPYQLPIQKIGTVKNKRKSYIPKKRGQEGSGGRKKSKGSKKGRVGAKKKKTPKKRQTGGKRKSKKRQYLQSVLQRRAKKNALQRVNHNKKEVQKWRLFQDPNRYSQMYR
jgi:hypothetical protein